MRVSIVIPNYNGLTLLKKNLPQVVKASNGNEIIIVDDASSDDSVKWVKSMYPQIKVIAQKTNKGFSATVNAGVQKATGELIYLLNSDVKPEKNFLKPLLPHFTNPKVFAVGSLQKTKELKSTIEEGRSIGRFYHGFFVHAAGKLDKSNTLWVFGGAGLYRKDIWDKLGGMETLYSPFYWEDIDLSFRALKSGYQIIFEPMSIVYHEKDFSSIKSHYSKSDIKSIVYRNQIFFVWLNITDYYYLLEHIIYLPYHILRSLLFGDFAFLIGLTKAFLKLPQVLIQRSKTTKLFIKSDKEIL